LTGVGRLASASDLPVFHVEVGARELDDGESLGFWLSVLETSPNAIDFTAVILETIVTLELGEPDEVLSRVIELAEVVGSEQLVDSSVSSLDTSVLEEAEDILDRARIEMEDVASETPASVLTDRSTLAADHELKFKSWLSVDELKLNVSEVIVHSDVLSEDSDSVHLGREGVVLPVASTD